MNTTTKKEKDEETKNLNKENLNKEKNSEKNPENVVPEARASKEQEINKRFAKAREDYKREMQSLDHEFGPVSESDKKKIEEFNEEYSVLFSDKLLNDPALIGLDNLLDKIESVPDVKFFLKKALRYYEDSESRVKDQKLPESPKV